MPPLVSIITPCYNHGLYLDEAIESIPFKEVDYEIEHIIINDGSTDPFTIEKLNELELRGHFIIHQNNLGLAAARNNAIKIAKGKYIIPLDSDNKLHINYLTKAIDILENNASIDVVYGNKMVFGNEEGLRPSKAFKLHLMIKSNYIDACAAFRKSLWERVGGYDERMRRGYEDWEFWINSYLNGAIFFYLNKICFYYRITDNSMRVIAKKQYNLKNKEYVIKKHAAYFVEYFIKIEPFVDYIKNNRLKASIKFFLGKI